MLRSRLAALLLLSTSFVACATTTDDGGDARADDLVNDGTVLLDESFVLFGGRDATWTRDATTRVMDTSTGKRTSGRWQTLTPPTSPTWRYDACSATTYDRAYTVVFGGYDGTTHLDETWLWNGATWKRIASPVSPPGRVGCSMTQYGTGILLVGGDDGKGYLDDTWQLTDVATDTPTWTRVTGPQPTPARSHAGLAAIGNRTGTSPVLFGGQSGSDVLGDTWIFRNGGWSKLAPHFTPSPRTSVAMQTVAQDGVYDVEVLLFGGARADGSLSDETWELKPNLEWSDISLLSTKRPAARRDAAMTGFGLGVALFGGEGQSGLLGDLWIWNGRAWTAPDAALLDPRPQERSLAILGTVAPRPATTDKTATCQGKTYGSWCGTRVGGDPNTLYTCDGQSTSARALQRCPCAPNYDVKGTDACRR